MGEVYQGARVHAGPSSQVAYVVSWLNEAQMKPRCAPGSSVKSGDSIPAAEFSPLLEVGGLGPGSIPAGARFPFAAPRL